MTNKHRSGIKTEWKQDVNQNKNKLFKPNDNLKQTGRISAILEVEHSSPKTNDSIHDGRESKIWSTESNRELLPDTQSVKESGYQHARLTVWTNVWPRPRNSSIKSRLWGFPWPTGLTRFWHKNLYAYFFPPHSFSPRHAASPQNQVPRKGTLHTTLLHMTSIKSAAIYLTTGGASSIPSRKELIASYLWQRKL